MNKRAQPTDERGQSIDDVIAARCTFACSLLARCIGIHDSFSRTIQYAHCIEVTTNSTVRLIVMLLLFESCYSHACALLQVWLN